MPAAPHRRAPVPRPSALRGPASRGGSALPCAAVAGVLLLTAGGCAGLRDAWDRAVASDVPHPAVPEPPPRVAGAVVAPDPAAARTDFAAGAEPRPGALTLTSAGAAAGSDAGDAVRTAGLDDPFAPAAVSSPAASPAAEAGPPRIGDADVVATVNGEPLLAGDLLPFARHADRIAALQNAIDNAPDAEQDPQRGLTPAQRDELRTALAALKASDLAEMLPAKIEEALLAQRMRRGMDQEQLASLDAMVGTIFRQTQLPDMIRRANAGSAANGGPPITNEAELKRLMADQGLSLQAVIDAWKPQQMAMAYVEQHTPVGSIRVSRGEVADYYETHLADFTPPKAARWSQIEVAYGGPAEKLAAVDALETAAERLRAGEDFAAVAAEASSGPHAADGGRWDWTTPDSLADEAADAALWGQPVGEIGAVVDCPRPHAGPGAGVLKLIRVDERRGDAAPPLSELRDAIEQTIEGEKKHRAITALLTEERARAQVEVFVPGAAWPPAG